MIRTNNMALLELFLFTKYAYFRSSQPNSYPKADTVGGRRRLICRNVLS